MADKCEIMLDEMVQDAVAGRLQAAPGQRHARHFECAICKNPAFDTPVRTNPCGHMYHQDCLERWLRGKQGDAHSCPTCRKTLPSGRDAFSQDHVVRAALGEVDVECPQECLAPAAKRFRFDDLGRHVRIECPMTKLSCSAEGCGEVLFRQQMAQSHLPKCEHVLVDCNQCNKKVKRGVLLGHQAGQCRVQCAYCKEEVLFRKKREHELQGCTGSVPVRAFAALREKAQRGATQKKRAEAAEAARDSMSGRLDIYRQGWEAMRAELDARKAETERLKFEVASLKGRLAAAEAGSGPARRDRRGRGRQAGDGGRAPRPRSSCR
eukprot:TRINITY_DN4884_c0_g1_i1.p1 TRINITY_DN4884_c0_g1~~TRINITY_DN4884_c0_g1_i1.p1  ORF type:complete len:355 (+),score=67.86 TRINITY_DN4884_c0_g1_i1:101-1066(+)